VEEAEREERVEARRKRMDAFSKARDVWVVTVSVKASCLDGPEDMGRSASVPTKRARACCVPREGDLDIREPQL
jgi:hypothetical protein